MKKFFDEMAEAVKVIVRCRPMNERECKLNCKVIVDMYEDKGVCLIRKPDGEHNQVPKQFTFDGAYYAEATTEQIYNDIAYPLVEGVVEGYNGTVFAYGQTGCGKSFSMQGVEEPPSQRGIIPRAFQHIFESIAIAENTKYLVHASYLEIYNEDVRDLLSKHVKDKLELKEHPDKGVYVRDLSMQRVSSVEECERIMDVGCNNRTVGATLMNSDSSRSHSIFTIYMEACDTGIDGGDHIRAGKLNLVDLAGSERQSKTGSTGERLKEATKINLSLSALGNVISALVDGRSKHIPYRDSKLTRLLQDSLGGNTKTLMVACLSPADNNYDETLSTLRYANRAKNIKNKPHINEDPKDALLREYQDEIKKLRGLLVGRLGPDGIKALLEGQSPLERPKPPVTSSHGTQEAASKIKQEYEAKIEQLKKQYEAEQSSNAKLQDDMSKLRVQYEQHMAQAGAALRDNAGLTLERMQKELVRLSQCDDDSSDVSSTETSSSGSESDMDGDDTDSEIDGVTKGRVNDVSTLMGGAMTEDTSSDNDVKVYRQSANFMLKLSELIYNHALEVSVKKSVHGMPAVKQAAREIALASSSTSDVGFYESSSIEGRESELAAVRKSPGQVYNRERMRRHSNRGRAFLPSTQITRYVSDSGHKGDFSDVFLDDDTTDEVIIQEKEAFKKLQVLQQSMVGGEKSCDEEAKKKHVSRVKHVDERKQQLAEASRRDDDDAMLHIYESIHNDVKTKDKAILQQKQQIEGLKIEIEDLNYEFERDRSEYLSSIRRQEQEIELLQSFLAKIHPTIRRDCNYSNIDRIRSEAWYDEDRKRWILPDLVVTKTSLPSAGINNSRNNFMSDSNTSIGYCPSSGSESSSSQKSDDDPYMTKLNRRNPENVVSNYFAQKRQNYISPSNHHVPPGHYHQNGQNVSPTFGNNSHKTVAQSSSFPYPNSYGGFDEFSRRPQKLDSLRPISPRTRKKKRSPRVSGPM